MDGPNSDYAMLHFESRLFPAPLRLQAWRDILRRKLVHVEVDSISEAPFEVDAYARILPGLRFGWGRLDASINRRTREIVARDNDDFFLLVNLDDSFQLSQRRREFTLRPGDAHVMSCAEQGNYMRPQAGRILCVRMSRAALSALVPAIDDSVLRVVPREDEALKLLTRYIMSLDNTQPLSSADLRERTVSHIYDLASLLIGASRDGAAFASRRGLRAARLKTIKEYVMANIGRSDLSVVAVAGHHGLTERYVQRLFEAEGTTFTHHVLEARLSSAFESLADPRKREKSIGALAGECGFGDVSYFNRAFRRRFGATPRDVRTGRAN